MTWDLPLPVRLADAAASLPAPSQLAAMQQPRYRAYDVSSAPAPAAAPAPVVQQYTHAAVYLDGRKVGEAVLPVVHESMRADFTASVTVGSTSSQPHLQQGSWRSGS